MHQGLIVVHVTRLPCQPVSANVTKPAIPGNLNSAFRPTGLDSPGSAIFIDHTLNRTRSMAPLEGKIPDGFFSKYILLYLPFNSEDHAKTNSANYLTIYPDEL